MARSPHWTMTAALIAAAVIIGPSIAWADSDRAEQALVFADTGQTIEFMVPASQFWLVIPKQGFVIKAPRVSGAPGPRYFELLDSERDMAVSGWLEAAERFPGITQLWEQQVKDWTLEEAPKPEKVSFRTEGAWEVAQYQTVKDGIRRDHLQAERIERGVWIDLQIVSASRSPDVASDDPALDLLRAIETRRN